MQPEASDKLSQEEMEVVDFLVELIPVLQEIKIDLEKKNLLDEGFLTKKTLNLYPLWKLYKSYRTNGASSWW